METQVQSFYPSPIGIKFISVFGYSTKGVPGLEINGLGKFGKNLKEKIIYMNKIRKIKIPVRRVVISLDSNELDPSANWNQLKWLEFPTLLAFWHLVGAVKVSTLEDCLCAGEIKVGGEVIHLRPPPNFLNKLPESFPKELKIIQKESNEDLWHMDSKLFLEHIPNLRFKTHMESVSETPIKSIMA
ncbi:MAG: hypothetical protein WD025_08135 [Bacteriovoracaceae bacterium]